MKKQPLRIFLICYCAYTFIYVARLNLSMAAPSMKELTILTTAQIGLLGSIFSVVYACGRLLSGIIADRTTPWKMISLGLLLCCAANLTVGLFPPFYAMLVMWGINAFGQSMLWGPILRILSAVYDEKTAKKRAANMSTAIAAGNLLGILLNTELINRLGAQWAFLIPGGITLIIGIFVVLFTRQVKPAIPETVSAGCGRLMKHTQLQQMLLPAVFHGVMKDNISLWMTVYVMDRFGIDLERSSYFILLIPALGFLGRSITPVLHQLCMGKEKPLILVSFALCVLCSVLLIVMPISAWVSVLYLSLLYMAISIINACMLSIFPMQFAQDGHVASVSGILDFATYLGTGLSAMIFGIMIDALGYESMFLTWVVLSVLAILLLSIRVKQNTR